MDISTYLTPLASQFIEKWCQLSNPDEFVRRLYFTIRAVHTIIKGQEAGNSTGNEFFKGRQAEKAPRFDKMATAALLENVKRAGTAQSNTRRNKSVNYETLLKSTTRDDTSSKYGNFMDPKAMK